MIFRKKLHLLPEKPIAETLENFKTQEENDMSNDNMSIGLAVLDKKDITVANTRNVVINPNIKEITIYPYDKRTCTILSEMFGNKQIVKVEFMSMQGNILDMTSYESVQNTYDFLNRLGYRVDSDKDLISLSLNKLVPSKKLVKVQKQLGKPAFPNSKVRQYKIEAIICYDINLIGTASISIDNGRSTIQG